MLSRRAGDTQLISEEFSGEKRVSMSPFTVLFKLTNPAIFYCICTIHRTKLHSSVTFAPLVLLQRLKARFPTARGSSGHRLFISAFMIAPKVIVKIRTPTVHPAQFQYQPPPALWPWPGPFCTFFYCSSLLFCVTN